MPTLASMKILPTTDWNEFELISQSALKIKWNSPNLQRNGRKGQPQAGVDIYGEDYLGRFSGIQCKNLSEKMDLKFIQKAVKKAEKFRPKLENFFIASTLPHDAYIQQQVRLYSSERVNNKEFSVGLFFWEDIVQELIKNEIEFQKYYPEISLKGKKVDIEATSLLCILDIVVISGTLQYKVELIFGEIGQMANEDPLGIRFFGNMLKNCSAILMTSENSTNFISSADDLVNLCLSEYPTEKENKNRWLRVSDLITKIEQDVPPLRYNYKGKKLAVYQLGVKLADWELATNHDKPLNKAVLNSIKKYLGLLDAPKQLIRDTEKLFNEYNKSESISVVHIRNLSIDLRQIFL